MPRIAAPPRTANAALSFYIHRCPCRLPIASAVKYERPAIASTAPSPTFTSHDVGAAALERVCARRATAQKVFVGSCPAWICPTQLSAIRRRWAAPRPELRRLLDAATTALPDIEAATVLSVIRTICTAHVWCCVVVVFVCLRSVVMAPVSLHGVLRCSTGLLHVRRRSLTNGTSGSVPESQPIHLGLDWTWSDACSRSFIAVQRAVHCHS